MVKVLFASVIFMAGALGFVVPANAQNAPANTTIIDKHTAGGWADSPDDPNNLLARIRARQEPLTGLIPVSPFQSARDRFVALKDELYDATHLKIGLSFHHLFQGATEVLQGTDSAGSERPNPNPCP